MRVALIHHQYKLKGGMETYFFNLIKGFTKQQDQVTAYVYKLDKQAPILCTIKHHNLGWLPRVWRKYWFGTRGLKKISNHDITISLMRALNQDIIICGGTHLGFLNHTQKKPTLFDRLEITMEKKSYQSSKVILAHSNMVKGELINLYGIDDKKIAMCFPPLDTEQYKINHTDKSILKRRFQLSLAKKSILFPSTGHKRKGLDVLIKAMQLLPKDQFELVVAGNEPNVAVENVNFIGFVADMPSLYHACDVTILPSYYEPFGLVVVESLHCGTPVIISKNVGAKDLVSKNEGVVLDHCFPLDIATAILEVTQKDFQIESHFADRHLLTIDAHINDIKRISENF